MQDADFAGFIGIDWADQKHAVCLAAAGTDRFEESELPQTQEAIADWAGKLRDRFGGRPIAVCLEQSRGALIDALMKYAFLVLFPINPKQLAKYREAFAPSGPKNDPSDARLLADFVRSHRAKLKVLQPHDILTRSILFLSEQRRKAADDRTDLSNQLQQTLKEFFPLALELLGDQAMYALWFLKLLAKFPSHKQLRRASPRSLEQVLPRRRRDADEQDPRIALIRSAQPLSMDAVWVGVMERHVKSLAQRLLQLNKVIDDQGQQLQELMAKHPDAAIFRSFPGAGEVIAPRLVAAFGTQRDRYEDATAVQQYSGIAPVTRQSGKTKSIVRRHACPKFMRQTFHEFAQHSLKGSTWALAYYRMLRAKGKRHHAAVRSLAFKWIRVLFRCWQDRGTYSEQQYLDRLRAKQSPILNFVPPLLYVETS